MPLLTVKELEESLPLFRGRTGNALGRGLMKMLSIDKVNDLYDRHLDRSGPDFANAVLEDIGVRYEVLNAHYLEALPEGPFIIVSNHPYGHIDGIILVDLFGHIRPDFKVMVNKFLGRIDTMGQNFICVTPIGTERGTPTTDNLQGVREALSHVRSGGALGLFPSGAVSDLSLKDRSIRDREWQEPVLRLIKKLNVPVIPVHFLDRNSNFYYSHWRVRLLRLPSEVFNKRKRRIRIAIGEIITPQQYSEITDIGMFRDFLREKVYDLNPQSGMSP